MSGLIARYRRLVNQGKLIPDPAQARAVSELEPMYQALTRPRPAWRRWLRRPAGPVRGLYLHGEVGRGKTLLMDLFAQAAHDAQIPTRRIHFHRFMDEIHGALKALENTRDPLARVAATLANPTRVLCFDEFHVTDIGDAMILGQLLEQLFAHRITLVATSNTAPDELYKDGLQRARFLPTIEMIKSHCQVLEVAAAHDYRLRELARHPRYYISLEGPLGTDTERELESEFATLAAGHAIDTAPIRIRARDLQPEKRAGDVIWFDFQTLCGDGRAAADYIDLARRFGTLIVSAIPVLDDTSNDPARRFIHLVDECYDRAVKLIVSAAAPVEALYRGTRLAEPFARTTSRLIEMQSRQYLARPHKP